ncbi:MAG: caspase family protein [Gemmatales bacterium]|nr:caspase family protein [Gemmatales bacterium]MDW8387555.1 caspase family protein [Gemmatales bacterium]
MSQVVEAVCPKCRKVLVIPAEWKESLFRCKSCGAVLKTAGAKVHLPSDAIYGPQAASNGETSLVAEFKARRRRRFYVKSAITAAIVLVIGVTLLVAGKPLVQRGQEMLALLKKEHRQTAPAETPKPEPDKVLTPNKDRPPPNVARPTQPAEAKTSVSKDGVQVAAADPGQPAPPDQPASPSSADASKPVPTPPTATVEWHKRYPGRALLVGIRNYLYANPLNPGYRPDNSLTRDPLGLHHLKKALIEGMRFDPAQVKELSDVAEEKPVSPLKPNVQATIRVFLEDSRPQDRVVLVFVGHAVEVEEQGYLVPLEGEFTKKDDLIPVSWLYEQLDKCKAHRKLLILDICHLDPEQGLSRSGGEKLGEKLAAQLRKVPDGVQVWLSCSSGEHSYEFASSGFIGSVFMHFLHSYARDLADPKKRREIEKQPGFSEESLPLLFFAPQVNNEVTKYVKDRWNAVQTPKVLGVAMKAPDVDSDAPPPPPVKIVEPLGSEPLADPRVVDEIIHELGIVEAGSQSLPPFFAKALEPYLTPLDRDLDPEKHPLRQVTLDTINKLLDIDKRFNAEKSIKAEANDAQFKASIERKQQQPARLNQELEEIMEAMEKAAADRDKDTKRWQAHFDYVFSQMLARRIAIMEYNFVLGNKLRKDSPIIMNPQNNGWLIVPTERLQQKDTRTWEKQRQEILDRIIKEHPGTPWEVLARRDKSTYLGLTLQEAKVD